MLSRCSVPVIYEEAESNLKEKSYFQWLSGTLWYTAQCPPGKIHEFCIEGTLCCAGHGWYSKDKLQLLKCMCVYKWGFCVHMFVCVRERNINVKIIFLNK